MPHHYMTLDEKEDWVEHPLSEADMAIAKAHSLTLETPEIMLKQSEGTNKDFTPLYAPTVLSCYP